jgi:serine/threonine protein kinase
MYESGTRIFDKYTLCECIGSGAFGEVWNADSVSTGESVAVKMERIQGNPAPTLQYESRVLQVLQGLPGIPKLRYFGRKDDMDGIFMVTDLLGPSLETVANSQRLDLNARDLQNSIQQYEIFISQIGRQMLQRLKSIHLRGMLHRDVKPDNFLFARTPVLDLSKMACRQQPQQPQQPQNQIPLLYLIDYGMAKRITPYSKPKEEGVRESGVSLIGSARYASVFAHCREPLGRRDDLISMMYSLIYVAFGGALPWQTYTEREIYYIKDNMTPSEICAGLSPRHANGWSAILEQLYSMQVHDVPEYATIESLL